MSWGASSFAPRRVWAPSSETSGDRRTPSQDSEKGSGLPGDVTPLNDR